MVFHPKHQLLAIFSQLEHLLPRDQLVLLHTGRHLDDTLIPRFDLLELGLEFVSQAA